ncbi:hypothetical protein [Micromonospora sp. SL4-19]|uniref:hypothetical protein n=1 Tax=Micromonospora sp. SL4-19 TaxID=3399129 RepID=UPI003A4D6E7C
MDDVVPSLSLAPRDGRDRYQSGMTGTRRVYRGRGLTGLVKLSSLPRARDVGHQDAATTNDAGNVAMLAINRRLGYRLAAGEWRYRRDFHA